jgi:cholesterol transport system auxiliary component
MPMIRSLALLAALSFLGACSAISALGTATAPLDAYEVRSTGDLPRAAGGPVSRDLIVEEPTAGGALDTDRILIRPTPLQAQYLPGARWTDTVPVMVQTLMVRGLQETGAVRFVGRRPIGLGGDFALLTEITDFHATVAPDGATVTTRIRFVANMVRESDAQVVASRVFQVDAVAPSTETIDIVQALDQSMARLMPDFVRWATAAIGARVS